MSGHDSHPQSSQIKHSASQHQPDTSAHSKSQECYEGPEAETCSSPSIEHQHTSELDKEADEQQCSEPSSQLMDVHDGHQPRRGSGIDLDATPGKGADEQHVDPGSNLADDKEDFFSSNTSFDADDKYTSSEKQDGTSYFRQPHFDVPVTCHRPLFTHSQSQPNIPVQGTEGGKDCAFKCECVGWLCIRCGFSFR